MKPHKTAKSYKALLAGADTEPACALKMLSGRKVDDDQDQQLTLEDGGHDGGIADSSRGISGADLFNPPS